MPTTKRRIQITTDEALDHAISEAQRSWGKGLSRSRIVHDLALRGQSAVSDDPAKRADGLAKLVVWSTKQGGLDSAALQEAKRSWVP